MSGQRLLRISGILVLAIGLSALPASAAVKSNDGAHATSWEPYSMFVRWLSEMWTAPRAVEDDGTTQADGGQEEPDDPNGGDAIPVDVPTSNSDSEPGPSIDPDG